MNSHVESRRLTKPLTGSRTLPIGVSIHTSTIPTRVPSGCSSNLRGGGGVGGGEGGRGGGGGV
jgi:hypothetical protein